MAMVVHLRLLIRGKGTWRKEEIQVQEPPQFPRDFVGDRAC
jgi:hypothetical protein